MKSLMKRGLACTVSSFAELRENAYMLSKNDRLKTITRTQRILAETGGM